jgi:hypothetical protein
MESIGDLRRGVGVDRLRYDHTCSTHRNTSKLKMISRVNSIRVALAETVEGSLEVDWAR